jgi:hypothetical protein
MFLFPVDCHCLLESIMYALLYSYVETRLIEYEKATSKDKKSKTKIGKEAIRSAEIAMLHYTKSLYISPHAVVPITPSHPQKRNPPSNSNQTQRQN